MPSKKPKSKKSRKKYEWSHSKKKSTNNSSSSSSTNINVHSRNVNRMSRRMFRTIQILQSTTDFLIPRRPFQRLVQEILQQYGRELRTQSLALLALQESTELHLTQHFERATYCTKHAKRQTLMCSDMKLVEKVRE